MIYRNVYLKGDSLLFLLYEFMPNTLSIILSSKFITKFIIPLFKSSNISLFDWENDNLCEKIGEEHDSN